MTSVSTPRLLPELGRDEASDVLADPALARGPEHDGNKEQLFHITSRSAEGRGRPVRGWQSAAPSPTHGQAPPGFALSESPRYAGRAIASLAMDPNRNVGISSRSVLVNWRACMGSPIWTAPARTFGRTWKTARTLTDLMLPRL